MVDRTVDRCAWDVHKGQPIWPVDRLKAPHSRVGAGWPAVDRWLWPVDWRHNGYKYDRCAGRSGGQPEGHFLAFPGCQWVDFWEAIYMPSLKLISSRISRAVARTSKQISVFAINPLSLNSLSLSLIYIALHHVHILYMHGIVCVPHLCWTKRASYITSTLI